MKGNIEIFLPFQVHDLLEINSSCYVKENCSEPATADMRRNVKETFLLQIGMNFYEMLYLPSHFGCEKNLQHIIWQAAAVSI